jgi:DNA polymerase III delta prime subunit
MNEQFLWVEKYRPKTISECILPSDLKATFQQFVEQGSIPNLILTGSAGVGKTTVAKAMLEQLSCDYIVINGSMNGNIDTLRNEILNFASTVSLSGGRKYVILDEADYLNANSTQPALRNFMEEFSANCGFILTCNFLNRIIEPLHSRCSVVEFKISKNDMAKLAANFFKRAINILETEGVTYEQPVVAEVINKHFPDWRRVLNELQRYSATGAIDSGILSNFKNADIGNIIELMKKKNFSEIRKWVVENINNDQNGIYRQLYDTASNYFGPADNAHLVTILAKYQYQAAFAADHEINLTACLVEIMMECEFK